MNTLVMAEPSALSRVALRPRLSVESLVLLASLYWLAAFNGPVLSHALGDHHLSERAEWPLLAGLAALVVCIHALMLLVAATRRTVKPLIALFTVVAAVAGWFVSSYGVYIDPGMLRNALATDPAEAGELVTPGLLLHLVLFAGLPLLALWRVRVRHHRWRMAAVRRLAALLLGLGVAVLAVLMAFQPLSSLMRNQRELRYLITPANVAWSLAQVARPADRAPARERQVVAPDALPGASWPARHKPLVVLLVVGETARAANWGLNAREAAGARDTTPQLARLDVVNLPDVRSCGTDTEASVPCMFSAIGRRDYDRDRIRRQESLLHVAARAGVQVHWRDNQSGCKGVCDGLPHEQVNAAALARLCSAGRCLDEALIDDLDARLGALRQPQTHLWVLHMLGNHGPSYFRRYPPAFERFQPACHSDELRDCPREHIVNAYDNALLYTDHVLATAIARLQARADQVDSAVLFVSDHGESLGEQGLFLHGMPYAIAPQVQTRVPMVFWSSAGFERAAGLKTGCLRRSMRAQGSGAVSHDHLFHTVLGLLDVNTRAREPALDLTHDCAGQAS